MMRGLGIDLIPMQPRHEREVVLEAAGEGLHELGILERRVAFDEAREDLRGAFTADEGFEHRPGRNTGEVRDHGGERDP